MIIKKNINRKYEVIPAKNGGLITYEGERYAYTTDDEMALFMGRLILKRLRYGGQVERAEVIVSIDIEEYQTLFID